MGGAPKEVTLGGAPKEVTLGERPRAAIREQLYDHGCIHPIVMAYIAPDSAMLHPGYRYFHRINIAPDSALLRPG